MYHCSHRFPSKLIKAERVKVFISPLELIFLTRSIWYHKQTQIAKPIPLIYQLIYVSLNNVSRKLESTSKTIRWIKFQQEPDRLRILTFTLTQAWTIYSLLNSVPSDELTRLRGNLEEILKKYPDLQL